MNWPRSPTSPASGRSSTGRRSTCWTASRSRTPSTTPPWQPVVRLEAGTLTGYPADSLIAISVTPNGLHLESAPEPEEHQLLAQTLGFFKEFMEVFGDDLPRNVLDYEWDDDLDVEENLRLQEQFEAEQEAEAAELTAAAEPVGADPARGVSAPGLCPAPRSVHHTGLAGDRHPGPAAAGSRGRHGGGVRF